MIKSGSESKNDQGVRRSTERVMLDRARQGANLWYYLIVKGMALKRRRAWRVGACVWTLMIVASTFVCGAGNEEGYKPILYPSIFWHNNQWETYENGQWIPYRGQAKNEIALEPEIEMAPELLPRPDTVDTNIYPVPYGWGFIGAPVIYARNRPFHVREYLQAEHQRLERRVNRFGQSNARIGRTTIGLGKPNVGIGQTTIGIGKPNAGIGQPNFGVGQQNVGIGQTTIGVGRPDADIGQQNVGVGQTTIGIGQPNVGIGQNNTGVGQPNVGIGQPTIGIGQQMSSPPSGWGTQRR